MFRDAKTVEHVRDGPAGLGQAAVHGVLRPTWSRIPQCSSKSSEMTRAPGRLGMLTVALHSLTRCRCSAARRSGPDAHRTPWRQRRRR